MPKKAHTEVLNGLDNAAKLLDTKVDDLEVVSHYAATSEHMSCSGFRDHPLAVASFNTSPPIRRCRTNALYNCASVYGFELFQCKDLDLRYVLATSATEGGPNPTYVVCKKNELLRLAMYFRRASKLAMLSRTNMKPVLSENMLNSIMHDTVDFLKASRKLRKLKIIPRRGIVLNGPPGNGKSMVCNYIHTVCRTHNLSFDKVTPSNLNDAYSDNRLEHEISKASVVVFDDVDIAYFDRSGARSDVACALLSAMDGIDSAGGGWLVGCVRIFTTNETTSKFDKAFLRPGRIDRLYTFELPTPELRRRLIADWDKELQPFFNIDSLVEQTDKMSFAQLNAIRTDLCRDIFIDQKTNVDVARLVEEVKDKMDDTKKRKIGFCT